MKSRRFGLAASLYRFLSNSRFMHLSRDFSAFACFFRARLRDF